MTTVKALIRKAHVYGDGVCGGESSLSDCVEKIDEKDWVITKIENAWICIVCL